MRVALSVFAGLAALVSAFSPSVHGQGMMAPPPVTIIGAGSVSNGAGPTFSGAAGTALHSNAAANVLSTAGLNPQTVPATVLTSPPTNADLANAASVLGTEAVFSGGMSYPQASVAPGSTVTYTPDILVVYPSISPRRLQDLLTSSRQQPGKESFPVFGSKDVRHGDVESLKGRGGKAARTDTATTQPSIEHDAPGTAAGRAGVAAVPGTPFVRGAGASPSLPQGASSTAPVPAASTARHGASSQDFSAHLEAGARAAKR